MRGAWLLVGVVACGGLRASAQPPPVIGLPVEPAAPSGPPVEVPSVLPAEQPAPRPEEPPRPRRDDFGIGGFGGFGAGGATGAPGYNAAYYPTRPTGGGGTDLGLVRQNLSFGAPVWRDGGDALILTGAVRNTVFFTDAVLPASRRPFPDTLWNVNLGLAYTHKFENGWTAGGTVGVGSASDKPFNSINEMTANVSAFLRVPARNDRDSWMFGVFYSPVGNLNFPVPIVAYLWNPSDRLRVNIGLPFSVTWRPTDDLTLSFSYVPVVNVNARVTYRVAERVSVFGGFEWLNEAYLLANRADDRDRFLVLEKRLLGGVRWDVWERGAVEFNAGYAFDREFGVGRNATGNLRDRVDVDPGAFLGVSLRLRF
ncbi:DUF6268 family outer membrane beta-barrel protein [Gemmata sp. JC673]|uniref:DUF6268 family outer membrane beta-barrel protein n=1 Tax=Gemmata algarum TaxID=2975278 RepID=A0ABU5F2V1_9BACT|nr:DUF6268 family outer membrane beta-barrel protein [Gemmata algarum]MDY3561514.1 DUF6268 family outer membrane beta-barrel protein [Gemmata algarum]